MYKKFIFKSILLILPFFFAFTVIEIKLNNIPTSYSILKTHFNKKKKNLDILIIGASESQLAIAPKYFIGYNTFNLSNTSQTIYSSCELVKQNLKDMPNLKFVVLNIGPMTLNLSYQKNKERWREKFYYNFWNIDPEFGSPGFMWKFKIGIYDQITIFSFILNDFKISSESGIFKIDSTGWLKSAVSMPKIYINDSCAKLTMKHYLEQIIDKNPINTDYIIQLRKILEQRKIKLIIIQQPASYYFYNMIPSRIISENKIQIKRMIEVDLTSYYNFQDDTTFLNSDYRDVNHLNCMGAEKASKKLYSIIKELGK